MLFRISLITVALTPFLSLASSSQNIERIQVKTKPPAYQSAILQVLPEQAVMDETSFSSDSLADLLSQSPSVNLNGQGGLLQAINIRGFARWRVQTLVEGIPIYTERRAGTSIEFVAPTFVEQAFITQGAASTQLGSGAIGGGVDLQLVSPDSTTLQLGVGSAQDFRSVQFQGSSTAEQSLFDVQWMFNHRHANNSEDGNGRLITDRFEQSSAALRLNNDNGWLNEVLLLSSQTTNAGKASADEVNERITLYPQNDHLLGKFTFDWHNAVFYFHQSRLETVITRPQERINETVNESTDWGLKLHNQVNWNGWDLFWRANIDARQNVKAFEREVGVDHQLVFDSPLINADQIEASMALDFSKFVAGGSFVAGTRLSHLSQSDAISDVQRDDTNISAFAGYAHAFGAGWRAGLYASNAYRVPSLTERFFNGVTPRGTVRGDVNLTTETARNVEINVSYVQANFSGSVAMFSQYIDDYIERQVITNDLRQYRNLESAKIQGASYQLQWDIDFGDWSGQVDWGGQWLSGENNLREDIADISPAQHRLGFKIGYQSIDAFMVITHRQSSSQEVVGERPTESATWLNLGVKHTVNESLSLDLNVNNLTDQVYFSSRDDLAPFARGRDVHLSLTYQF
jgi:iron complex outermembrane receptor protein